jgi:hypothetical protein
VTKRKKEKTPAGRKEHYIILLRFVLVRRKQKLCDSDTGNIDTDTVVQKADREISAPSEEYDKLNISCPSIWSYTDDDARCSTLK